MKTVGWIFIVIGVLAFLGAASKGHSVFGPLFWIGLGGALIYLKREKEDNNKKDTAVTQSSPKQPEQSQAEEPTTIAEEMKQDVPVTFEQKEAALCLVAFFAGYNDNIQTNNAAYLLSYQSAIFFGINNYKETLTAALPKYQDADKLIDTVLTIKDRKSKEFILLTCYDLTKMSRKTEAYEFLSNIAAEMGYDKERLERLVELHSDRPTYF